MLLFDTSTKQHSFCFAVRLPPKIIQHPESLHIYESGETGYKMPCVAEGIPKVEYSWKKNGEDFELNRQNIKVDTNTGSFTFTSLSRLDEGELFAHRFLTRLTSTQFYSRFHILIKIAKM